MKKLFLLSIILFMCTIPLIGASDHFSNIGKINTVIACVAVLIIGIVLFLFYLEKRISKLEKDLD